MSLKVPAIVSQTTRIKEEPKDDLLGFENVLQPSARNRVDYGHQGRQATTTHEHPQPKTRIQSSHPSGAEFRHRPSWENWDYGSSVAVSTGAADSVGSTYTATEAGLDAEGRVAWGARMTNMSSYHIDDEQRINRENEDSEQPLHPLHAFAPWTETDFAQVDAIDPTLLYDLSVRDQHEVIFGGASEAAYSKVNAILQQNRKDAAAVASTS